MSEKWTGIERRKNQQVLSFCPAHIELVEDMAVIKTSIKNIEKIMSEGLSFRQGVMISFIGLVFLLVAQISGFAYIFGQMDRQIKINTGRLDVLEQQERDASKIRSANVSRIDNLEGKAGIAGPQGIQGIQGRDGRDR